MLSCSPTLGNSSTSPTPKLCASRHSPVAFLPSSLLTHGDPFFGIGRLEVALREYSCLTRDRHIAVPFHDQTYLLRVKDLRPSDAVSIVETDLSTEFALPGGAEEEERPASAPGVPGLGHFEHLSAAGDHLFFGNDADVPEWARTRGPPVIETSPTAAEAAAMARRRKAQRDAKRHGRTLHQFGGGGYRVGGGMAASAGAGIDTQSPPAKRHRPAASPQSPERPHQPSAMRVGGGEGKPAFEWRGGGRTVSGAPAPAPTESNRMDMDSDDEDVEVVELSVGGRLIRPKRKGSRAKSGSVASPATRSSAAPAASVPPISAVSAAAAAEAARNATAPLAPPRLSVREVGQEGLL